MWQLDNWADNSTSGRHMYKRNTMWHKHTVTGSARESDVAAEQLGSKRQQGTPTVLQLRCWRTNADRNNTGNEIILFPGLDSSTTQIPRRLGYRRWMGPCARPDEMPIFICAFGLGADRCRALQIQWCL
jgi:hypothetical protein